MLRNRAARIGIAVAGVIASGAAPSVDDLIQRSDQAVQKAWQLRPAYAFFERDTEDHGTKTYHVTMIDGTPYKELVEINEHKLTPEQQQASKQNLERTKAARDAEPPEQRQRRIASYNKDRQRDHEFLNQLTEAFNFKFTGEKKVGEFQTYELQATPKPGYQPPDQRARVLTGMRGTLWIDEATDQWVKVQAEVIHPVSIEGFLAEVEPGTRFELERRPVERGLWLPSHFSVHAHARILGLFGHNSATDESYYGYQKAE